MLDRELILNQTELVKRAVKAKGSKIDVDKLVSGIREERKLRTELDQLNAERNRQNTEIAQAGKTEQSALLALAKNLKTRHKDLSKRLREVETMVQMLEVQVPNLPWDQAPVGDDESANRVVKTVGQIPAFKFPPKDHITLGQTHDLIDLERGANTSGFRGYYLKNEAVLLQYGLLWLGLQIMKKHGYTLMAPPSIVKDFALFGSGHFPFGKNEIFQLGNPDKTGPVLSQSEPVYLAGTSEPALLAYYANTTVKPADLPLKLSGISPCYREEAGSYGKYAKGLYRLREFMKVEQVIICNPDQDESDRLFAGMLDTVEEYLGALAVPYRLVETSTGDMGAGKRRMVDVETWMPSRNDYGETHSCSDCTDWQARRLGIRVQESKQRRYAFTLNCTVIASPRLLIALLENHQRADGSIDIPKILQPYVGLKRIAKAS